MKREKVIGAILGSVMACSMMAAAQEKGTWRATSSTAQSITGDVAITEEKLFINFSGFVIAQIRSLTPSEVSSVFEGNGDAGGHSSLYRLSIPAEKKFLHKNTLCGNDETQWMATYVAGRTLHLAFFSGQTMPVFTPEAVANATNLCGTFSYDR